MCLSIPAKVISIDGDKAICSVGGAEYETSLQMVEDVAAGDYILMHTGFAIEKISEEEAIETLKTFEEYEEFNKKLDEEEKNSGSRIL